MRPLVIGEEEKGKLHRIREYAEKHPYSMAEMLDLLNGEAKGAGLNPDLQCILPVDFRVVFSIEAQKHGQARHLSISVPGRGKVPNEFSCLMVMDELGFQSKFIGGKCRIWLAEEA